MNKKLIIGAIIGAFVVAGASAYAARDTLFQSATTSSTDQADTSSSMYKDFAALKGEEFDRRFIADMIVHHKGAVEMAKLALENANRTEIKSLANDIVSAQEKEIADMTKWQKDWGYSSNGGDEMAGMDMSAMGSMEGMSGMTAELDGKTGDEFDKTFIEQMILHHQSAINMAAPAETNAKRQEVKELARGIITAQTKEIKQMKQWQADWGY